MSFLRFDIFYVNLDPTIGGEIKKTRPCIIISPDEMNLNLSTVIIAPITTKHRNYPTRISTIVENKPCQIVLDQIRTVDKTRLMKRIDSLNQPDRNKLLNTIKEIFSA